MQTLIKLYWNSHLGHFLVLACISNLTTRNSELALKQRWLLRWNWWTTDWTGKYNQPSYRLEGAGGHQRTNGQVLADGGSRGQSNLLWAHHTHGGPGRAGDPHGQVGPGSQDQLHQHPQGGGLPGEGAEDVPQTGGGPHQCQGLDDSHEGGLGAGREACPAAVAEVPRTHWDFPSW